MTYISGIHHVSLKCQNDIEFEKMISFYHGLLQLSIKSQWGEGKERGIMFDTGNGYIEIFGNGTSALPQGNIRHVALACNNVKAIIEEVRNAGYVIIKEPTDIENHVNPSKGGRIAFCEGPLKEQIEFYEEIDL